MHGAVCGQGIVGTCLFLLLSQCWSASAHALRAFTLDLCHRAGTTVC